MRSVPVLVLGVLLMSLAISETAYPAENVQQLLKLGREMTREDKTLLEEQLAKKPNDVESRTKLLGYYLIKGRQDSDAGTNKERHIIWLIENAPESEVLGLPYSKLHKVIEPKAYSRAANAWKKTLSESPENLSILKNAAAFFLIEDRKFSEDLLLKGQALDPKNSKWAASLGELYSLDLMSLPAGADRKATAKKAFDQNHLAYNLSEPEGKDALLTNLAKSAFAAGLNDEAKRIATDMIDDDAQGWNRGNRIHHGNIILGQLAIIDGNIDEAKSRLLLAGKTEGSPQLNSFGPSMTLAKELLERGERDVVLDYFELCKKFWKSGDRNLKQWSDEVKANRIPQFGANLRY